MHRALGYTGTVEITIWDLDDCHKGTGGPKCPEESVGNGGDSEQDGGSGGGNGGDDNGDGNGDDEGGDNGYEGGNDNGDENGDDEDDEEDEDTPSNVPLVACDFDNYDADSTSITTVSWYYWVESSAEDNSNVADEVCGAMSTAIIGSFDNKCATRQRRRRLNHQNRQLELQAYSREVTCDFVADCVPTNEASGSCGVYQGTMQVAYDDEGENSSASEVSETVHAVAEDTLSGDGAAGVEATVAESLDDSANGDQLTGLGYGNPNDEKEKDVGTAGLSGEVFRDTSNQGLSRAGKAAIAAMSALILLLLLLCCICWRRKRNRNGGKGSGGSSGGSMGTDATLASSPGRRGFFGGGSASKGSLSDDDTYLTSDYNNLGLHHSKLDVHQCQSASCLQCSPIVRDNENGVFFVNSKGGSPLSDIVEEEMMSGYKSSSVGRPSSPNVQDDDDDQEDSIGGYEVPPPPPVHAPPPLSVNGENEPAATKKSFFSKFRPSKKSSSTQQQPVVMAEGGADGGGVVEVEI